MELQILLLAALLCLVSAYIPHEVGFKYQPVLHGKITAISSVMMCSDESSASTDGSSSSSTLPPKGTSPKLCPYAPGCGCDGTGKMQGGIATIGFMSWWPIKVYRPCPEYIKGGYVYKREGQTMDQVLFSEPSTKMQETMKQRRIAEAKEALEATKAKATLDSELALMKKSDDDITSAADQLLENKFGEN